MSTNLELMFIFFLAVAILVMVAIAIFIVLWLINLNKLTKSLTKSADEIAPLLTELQNTLKDVNKMLDTATDNVNKFRKIVMSLLGVLSIFLGGFKNVSGSVLKGVLQGIKLFIKK